LITKIPLDKAMVLTELDHKEKLLDNYNLQ